MANNQKLRYEIDPLNRLILKSAKTSNVPDFRGLLDGEFKIDKKNILIYRVKKSSSGPRQLKLTGNYSIDDNHNLMLTLNNENNQQSGNKLTIKGEIIGTRANELAFSVSTKDSSGRLRLYILKLSGRWQADKYNRLSFQVTKENSSPDTLTFSGSWQINKNNEVIYTCVSKKFKRQSQHSYILTFRGYWEITDKYRLLYVLNKELSSEFDFKVSLGKPAARGLKYEIGIGAVPKKKTITLFGNWKINQHLGLFFEMPAESGKIRSVAFGADCKLKNDYTVNFRLKNNFNRDLGVNLRLSKAIFGNQGQIFTEILKETKEISIVAGIGFKW